MSELQSSVGSEGGFVCLVDGDGEYNLSEQRLQQLIQHVDPKGTQDYSIVGIMGCQSTGKSTLLNRLFNTQFAMMNAETGRSQTTKGIWLDAARNTNNLVVMDLEGTDSGERGEDRTTFERQTILYALALCEILIINMWETDIGRYTASNYGIMKTVFEVNLQLFKAQGKTMLLFIIRDYNEDGTPFHTLQQRLLREIQAIWDELRKPEEFKDSTMYDLFDFKFTFLPHYVYKRERFEKLALQLKEKFIDPNHPDSYLATPYHGCKSVPAESFAKYSSSIWHTIKENQDLNLPTQREMLAAYRCDELIKIYSQQLTEQFIPVYAKLEQLGYDYKADLPQDLINVFAPILKEFHNSTEKYHEGVVNGKKQELLGQIAHEIHLIATEFIVGYSIPHFTQEFHDKFSKSSSSDNTVPLNEVVATLDKLQADILGEFKEECKKEFADKVNEGLEAPIMLPPSYDSYQVDLVHELNQFHAAVCHKRLQTLLDILQVDGVDKITKHIELLLTNPQPSTFWPEVGEILEVEVQRAFKRLETDLSIKKNTHTIVFTADDKYNAYKRIFVAFYLSIKTTLAQYLRDLPSHMRKVFEQSFYVNGSPRQWKKTDDPNAIFNNARRKGYDLLELFYDNQIPTYYGEQSQKIATEIYTRQQLQKKQDANTTTGNIVSGGDLAYIVIIEPEELVPGIARQTHASQFENSIQPYLNTAIAEVERAKAQTGIPPWVFPLVIILGYNEFMYILSNPLLLLLIILLGVGAFVIHQLGLSGPVLTILKALYDRVLEQAVEAIAGDKNTKKDSGNHSDDNNNTHNFSPSSSSSSLSGYQDRRGSVPMATTNLAKPTSTIHVKPTMNDDSDDNSPGLSPQPISPAASSSSLPSPMNYGRTSSNNIAFNFDQLPDDSTIDAHLSKTADNASNPSSTPPQFTRQTSTGIDAGARQRLKRMGTMTLKRGQIQQYLQQQEQDQ